MILFVLSEVLVIVNVLVDVLVVVFGQESVKLCSLKYSCFNPFLCLRPQNPRYLEDTSNSNVIDRILIEFGSLFGFVRF